MSISIKEDPSRRGVMTVTIDCTPHVPTEAELKIAKQVDSYKRMNDKQFAYAVFEAVKNEDFDLIKVMMRRQSDPHSSERIKPHFFWWRSFSQILKESSFRCVNKEVRSCFRSLWAESGRAIRDVLNNNEQALVMLRSLMPAYEGDIPRVLYRGENPDDFDNGTMGFNWTAAGLDEDTVVQEFLTYNSSGRRQLLLTLKDIEMEDIISGPVTGQGYQIKREKEFLIDPTKVRDRVTASYSEVK